MVDIVIICYCYRLLLSLAYHTHYFRCCLVGGFCTSSNFAHCFFLSTNSKIERSS